MGGSNSSSLKKEQIAEYELLTFLRPREIVKAHSLFKSLSILPPPTNSRDPSTKIPAEDVINKIPELRYNPFAPRICEVFSSSKDRKISFEDFLDMLSVFSERATLSVKTAYAFRIYDFNNDGVLCRRDLEEIVRLLVTTDEQRLRDEDMKRVTDNVLKEVDVDEDGFISFPEFDHAISKCPDFLLTFRMCIV
uniref:Calcium and integrin-binding protein 1 n=1 Tax=Caligus clemensi TaxID=344056 RepID=C1C2I9_CALCM|nr:Calcium and integrin-binding protein 1 [Caligus clemensi]